MCDANCYTAQMQSKIKYDKPVVRFSQDTQFAPAAGPQQLTKTDSNE